MIDMTNVAIGKWVPTADYVGPRFLAPGQMKLHHRYRKHVQLAILQKSSTAYLFPLSFKTSLSC